MSEKTHDNQRNAFVALCDYASRNNWCWNIFCATCGHGAFRVSFSKIVRGEHLDDNSFFPFGQENHVLLKEINDYNDFWRDADNVNQIKLATVVANAKLTDIQAVAKFPDWLGYIGLIIYHCPNREARKIISDSFLPQFISMYEDNKSLKTYLEKKLSNGELLSINDLSRIETGSVDLENPPLPLITDIM